MPNMPKGEDVPVKLSEWLRWLDRDLSYMEGAADVHGQPGLLSRIHSTRRNIKRLKNYLVLEGDITLPPVKLESPPAEA